MRGDDLEARVEAIRRFNRLFTRRIGVLREGLYTAATRSRRRGPVRAGEPRRS